MWQRIKTLFQEADQSSISNPILHTILERSETQESDFRRWADLGKEQQFFSWLRYCYNGFFNNQESPAEIKFLDTTSKKGFVLYLNRSKHIKHPEYIMDAIWLRIKNLGYRNYVSDQKSYNAGSTIETSQRHYLKPPLNFSPGNKLDQLYGNICIELILKNDHPQYLKFSATTYQDHMFQQANKFSTLIEELCSDN
ncbi:MAG: hypothetical protein KJP00_03960 [Bacteroidia bacterium]|nr:hypothetical protein [Bacteroidia bacterium]